MQTQKTYTICRPHACFLGICSRPGLSGTAKRNECTFLERHCFCLERWLIQLGLGLVQLLLDM